MAVDELSPCDMRIFREGKPIALIEADPNKVQDWVKLVAGMANVEQGLDWHYTGPVAQVLLLDDSDDPKRRARVERAAYELEPLLGDSVLKRFTVNEPGIYRRSPRKTLERAYSRR